MMMQSKITSLLALVAPVCVHGLSYMPFGDSITEITCWRDIVYQQLQADGYTDVDFVGSVGNTYSCTPSNFDYNNEGHSGYLAINIDNQNQLSGWLSQNPADIITMHLGTNDIAQGHSTNDILTAFTDLVGDMRASNPNMRIIVSISMPRRGQKLIPSQVAQIIPLPYADSGVQALNAAIPQWASSHNTTESPIWVVDQYTGFSSSDLRDGVHPNQSGDTKMAAKWYPALTNAIASLNGTSLRK
jgi:lysophospholipase L1-like esterase